MDLNDHIVFLIALHDVGMPVLCLSLDLGPAIALKLCLRTSLGVFLFGFVTLVSQQFKVSSSCVSSLGTLLLCCLRTLRPDLDKSIFTDCRILIVKPIQFLAFMVMIDEVD